MHTTPINLAMADVGPASEGTMSLEDRAKGAFAELYVDAGNDRAGIVAASNDPHTASDPAQLAALQLEVEDYTKRMTIWGGLAHHATSTVETLLKS